MATLADLRSAVASILALPSVPGILQLNSNTRERAFEAYVFSLVVQAVRQAGGTADLYGINTGLDPNPVIFRGAPGYMGSRAQDFCFARCSLNGLDFEVHVDVIYVGGSGATHEVDVSIYDANAADAVRQMPGAQPRTRSLRAAFECKCYDSNLGTALGRGFVGLVADCGQLKIRDFVTNGHSQGLARYFSKSGGPNSFFGVSPVVPTDARHGLFTMSSKRYVNGLESHSGVIWRGSASGLAWSAGSWFGGNRRYLMPASVSAGRGEWGRRMN